jgi:hypothetical protein
MNIEQRIQIGGWYVKCRLCPLPHHPGLNCEAEEKRLMDYAKTAKDRDPIPYAGYPGLTKPPSGAAKHSTEESR